MENYVDVFNKIQESTVSSHLGMYYGHYTVLCENEMLAKVNLIFMAINFKVGIPLSR